MTGEVDDELLLWRLPVSVGGQLLELVPGVLPGNVNINVDGRRRATLDRPRPGTPWTQTTLQVGGSTVTVVGIAHDLVMHTNVFVDGISLRDGGTIGDTRPAMPHPLGAYERWFNTGFTLTRGKLLPSWLAPLAGLGILGFVVVGMGRLAGSIGGGIALVSGWLLILVFVRLWFGLTVMTHRWLLAHPAFGDIKRALLMTVTFLGIPVLLLGLPAIVLVAVVR